MANMDGQPIRSYKYRLYPNGAQEAALSDMLGHFRDLCNAGLLPRACFRVPASACADGRPNVDSLWKTWICIPENRPKSLNPGLTPNMDASVAKRAGCRVAWPRSRGLQATECSLRIANTLEHRDALAAPRVSRSALASSVTCCCFGLLCRVFGFNPTVWPISWILAARRKVIPDLPTLLGRKTNSHKGRLNQPTRTELSPGE